MSEPIKIQPDRLPPWTGKEDPGWYAPNERRHAPSVGFGLFLIAVVALVCFAMLAVWRPNVVTIALLCAAAVDVALALVAWMFLNKRAARRG